MKIDICMLMCRVIKSSVKLTSDNILTVNNFHDFRGCEGLLLRRSKNSKRPTEVVFHQMSHDAANHHILTGAAQLSQVMHLANSGNLNLHI